jgi:hypothetical protein
VAVQWKYAAPKTGAERAVWEMARDGFAVLENMTVAIDQFNLRFHKSSLLAER